MEWIENTQAMRASFKYNEVKEKWLISSSKKTWSWERVMSFEVT